MALNYHESTSNLSWRQRLHEVIYEADSKAGKRFDVVLFVLIVASVLLVMVESVDSLNTKYYDIFIAIEWVFTIFFSLEYIGRIVSVKRPLKYIFSFYGVIDLLSILPSYIGIFIPSNAYNLRVLRILRLMRIFRVLKLIGFLKEARFLVKALKASQSKIMVFLFAVLLVVTVMGTLLYIIEGNANSGFDSIPRSIYWAIVTITTVGYGDISPQTEFGQLLASVIMLIGYAIIAVPTGIVTSELTMTAKKKQEEEENPASIKLNTQSCRNCHFDEHDDDALHCKKCGESLHYTS